ncbi:50S ribosomal protein L29 [Candidatus Roizmanbacteria bacterium RIFCSPHIGHO2_12_FULL_44_10]|uniref:Large ribosomal subunit protein uL29 n=1 Tax=Candidatus Roizmanbacteria bacterium RIFCSPHIGHO2_12_FULL_44_10 TaxID=1802054 RepID=A0A1F7I8E5_9BACT|nr:MAG: 50S ribosomal protein L29 [Candidatus Roizmanbacteria bacterium RIFCSPHIGHO2_12_FULL_44_10]
MKKKNIQDIKQGSAEELRKAVQKLRGDIAKAQLDAQVNPPKNTNAIGLMKREVAMLLTAIREKELIVKNLPKENHV